MGITDDINISSTCDNPYKLNIHAINKKFSIMFILQRLLKHFILLSTEYSPYYIIRSTSEESNNINLSLPQLQTIKKKKLTFVIYKKKLSSIKIIKMYFIYVLQVQTLTCNSTGTGPGFILFSAEYNLGCFFSRKQR